MLQHVDENTSKKIPEAAALELSSTCSFLEEMGGSTTR